jgi:hypothetical protein
VDHSTWLPTNHLMLRAGEKSQSCCLRRSSFQMQSNKCPPELGFALTMQELLQRQMNPQRLGPPPRPLFGVRGEPATPERGELYVDNGDSPLAEQVRAAAAFWGLFFVRIFDANVLLQCT